MFRLPVDPSLDLVLLEARHAGMLFALVEENRAFLRRWLPWVDATRTVADSHAWIQRSLEEFALARALPVGLLSDRALAGVCDLHGLDWGNRRAHVGYWLGEAWQGRGLMTRAVRALTTHAFVALGLHRLEIHAATENRRSRAVAERLGFRLEGTLRQAEWLHERFVDHAVYGALAPEWRPPPGAAG